MEASLTRVCASVGDTQADFEALSRRESTMDPVVENVLVELLVDLPADADIPVVASAPERTWLWSDLHLSDPSVLLGWGRPFGSVEERNRHVLGNWRRRIGAGDTVICLGDDVTDPDAWRDDRLVLDLAERPGERLLVLGNHDRDVPALRRAGFHKTCRTALCATDTPLGLTHVPLLKVPTGAVNVHGHLHRGPTDRHVNVSVEHTDYAPVGLTLRPRACLQTPGTERRHVTTGFAVAVEGEELPTVATAMVGVFGSPLVAVGVLVVNGNFDKADGFPTCVL